MIARIGRPMAAAPTMRLIDVVDRVFTWIERSRQHAQLARIDVTAMQDLGISRADLDAESRKHFWQS